MTAARPFHRPHWLLSLLLIGAALGCGGEDSQSDIEPADGPEGAAAAEVSDPGEPGLPSDSSRFRPTNGGSDAGLAGTLWVAAAQPGGPDGISLIAQLDDVTPSEAFAWAVHRGDCSATDDPVLALGHGTEAVGGEQDRSEKGGPLGESRAAFQSGADGTIAESVWVPFDGVLDRATFQAGTFSLRIHPWTGGEGLTPSVACAVIPTPRSGG